MIRTLHVMVIYNRLSGQFSKHALNDLVERLENLGHRVTSHDCRDPGSPPLGSAMDVVCIMGGDGTVRSVVGAQRDRHGGVFWVHPSGTANLLAREAGYAGSVEELVDFVARSGKPRPYYHGLINGQPLLCCASVGLDSLVVDRVTLASKRRWGRAAYGLALFALRRASRTRFEVMVDGTRHEAEAVYVCNGRYYAGPWVLDDRAGLPAAGFRIILLPRARRRDMARLYLSALLGRWIADPRWLRMDAQEMEIRAATSFPVQVDGDIIAHTPVRISAVPEPLNFM